MSNIKENKEAINNNLCDMSDELCQTIKLMQMINEGIIDVNTGRTMSLDEAKKRLL